MTRNNAKKEFLRFLASRGESISGTTPSAALETMMEFYQHIRAEGCNATTDQDMLLFQWGTYNWGDGNRFEFDITRQFIWGDGEDADIWQLHLTFSLPPSAEISKLGRGDRWCRSLAELPDFASFIRSHPTTTTVGARRDALPSLEYECAA